MSWTGLTSESKRFCSYETKSTTKKIGWWFEYVFSAAPRFWFYTLKDKYNSIKRSYNSEKK